MNTQVIDRGAFPDVGASAARVARSEVQTSDLYAKLSEVLREAEDLWCKAATRENARKRRAPFYTAQYSAEELFAEHLLESFGTPDEPVPELVDSVAEIAAEHERRIAI